MNALSKKFTAIGVAGTVGLSALAFNPLPVAAAPVAPNQDGIKQAAPNNKEDVRRRRHRHRGYGPALALGAFAAFAGAIAHRRHHRHYYYGHHYPAYGYYYGPPRHYYYGW